MMRHAYYTIFPTAIGTCGIAWRHRQIVAVQLPEATPTKTRARLAARLDVTTEKAPPPWVQRVIHRIVAYLEGKSADPTGIPIDLSALPPFHQKIYTAARTIPAGHTVTYGELAAMAGSPCAARATGQALARNPFPLLVPCHRILAANGRLGGFTAYRGPQLKMRLLALEKTTR